MVGSSLDNPDLRQRAVLQCSGNFLGLMQVPERRSSHTAKHDPTGIQCCDVLKQIEHRCRSHKLSLNIDTRKVIAWFVMSIWHRDNRLSAFRALTVSALVIVTLNSGTV